MLFNISMRITLEALVLQIYKDERSNSYSKGFSSSWVKHEQGRYAYLLQDMTGLQNISLGLCCIKFLIVSILPRDLYKSFKSPHNKPNAAAGNPGSMSWFKSRVR